jgi:hypothetical protein
MLVDGCAAVRRFDQDVIADFVVPQFVGHVNQAMLLVAGSLCFGIVHKDGLSLVYGDALFSGCEDYPLPIHAADSSQYEKRLSERKAYFFRVICVFHLYIASGLDLGDTRVQGSEFNGTRAGAAQYLDRISVSFQGFLYLCGKADPLLNKVYFLLVGLAFVPPVLIGLYAFEVYVILFHDVPGQFQRFRDRPDAAPVDTN